MRAKLYLISAALFQQPHPDILRRLREQALNLQREGPGDAPWRALWWRIARPPVCDDDLRMPNTTSPVFGLCCGPRGASNLLVAGRNLCREAHCCCSFLWQSRSQSQAGGPNRASLPGG